MRRSINAVRNGWNRLRGFHEIEIDGRTYACDPYHYNFWTKVKAGRWEPNTFTILKKFLDPSSVYYDIGAWIGPTVLYAARRSKKVVCFEPDPIAYKYLLWNIELNGLQNVLPFNVAVTEKTELLQIMSNTGRMGDSTTSQIRQNPEAEALTVLGAGWGDIEKREKRIDFIKMDIEGGEYSLLPAMKKYLKKCKPILYVSLHPVLFAAEKRREKMEIIMDVFSVYHKCFTEELKPFELKNFCREDVLNSFNSYVLYD